MEWSKIPAWLEENLPKIIKLIREHPRISASTAIVGIVYAVLAFYTAFQPKWQIYEYLHAVDERRWEDAHAALCPRLGDYWSVEDMKTAYMATKKHISPEITAMESNPGTLMAWVRGDLDFKVDVGYEITLGPGDLWNPARHEDALWAELKNGDRFKQLPTASKPMEFTLRTVRLFEMRRCGLRWKIEGWDTKISYRLDY